MKKSLKHLVIIAIAGCLSISSAMVSFADWVVDEYGSKGYLKEDGNYAYDEWLQIGDKWYYFHGNFAKAPGITKDGYTIGMDGSWDQSIPQMTHEQIRAMYFEEINDLLVPSYEYFIAGIALFDTEEEWDAMAATLSKDVLDEYPTLTVEDILSNAEIEQLKQKVKSEDINELLKGYIKDDILYGNVEIYELDDLITFYFPDASPEYKEQVKAEVLAEYEHLLGPN